MLRRLFFLTLAFVYAYRLSRRAKGSVRHGFAGAWSVWRRARTFRTKHEMKVWLADARRAANQTRLRYPMPTRLKGR